MNEEDGRLTPITAEILQRYEDTIAELCKEVKSLRDSVSQGKVLWSGVWFGSSGSALLAEPLSAQKNGILLVWSAYEDNEAKDWSWVYTFVPRWHAVAPTGTHGIVASAVNVDFVMAKYLYVCDEKIDSYPANEQTISVGGITVENWRWALRCVLGV